jgi:hypothetical protein
MPDQVMRSKSKSLLRSSDVKPAPIPALLAVSKKPAEDLVAFAVDARGLRMNRVAKVSVGDRSSIRPDLGATASAFRSAKGRKTNTSSRHDACAPESFGRHSSFSEMCAFVVNPEKIS